MRVALAHFLLCVVAGSYVVLGVAEPESARNLWGPYAIVVFVMAIYNLIGDLKRG